VGWLPSQIKGYVNLIISVMLAAVVLAVSLLCSRGVEILSDKLWDPEEGQEPPIDVSLLVTGAGIVGAIGIIGFTCIDVWVTWRRAVREGDEG
jgi:hypothetical protein